MRKTMVLILSLIMICTASVFIAFNTPAYTASAHSTDQENDCLSDYKKRLQRTVTVSNEDEIVTFWKSERYDSNVSYLFICPSQTRILCPRCRKNNYRGITEHREIVVRPRQCPGAADFVGDTCVEYHVYSYSFCDYCGYKTTPSYGYKYWLVQCHVEMPDGWGTFIARPGQTWQQGYDFHEDPYYMNLMY